MIAPPPAVLTVREAIARAAEFFATKGIPTARLDAELLIGHASGLDRLALYLNLERPLTPEQREASRELMRRRAAREPVAYILGEREFMSRPFEVTAATLIPRPETEQLVELALEHLHAAHGPAPAAPKSGMRPLGAALQTADENSGEAPPAAATTEVATAGPASAQGPGSTGRIALLEFGTGTGCIAINLAVADPRLEIWATEISPEAAAVARRNATRHGVAERVHVVECDWPTAEALAAAGAPAAFAAVLSNPPYIAEADRPTLAPEVAQYEPATALFAAEEGLYWLHRLIDAAPAWLAAPGAEKNSGLLLLEFGAPAQAAPLLSRAQAAGLGQPRVLQDYARTPRFLRATS